MTGGGGFSRHEISLKLRHVFTIARGSRSVVPSMIVTYSRDGLTGYGEASPIARYGESLETVNAFLDTLGPRFPPDPADLGSALSILSALPPGDSAAKAAVDIALHDWNGKRNGSPVWRSLGLDPGGARPSSMTIGIDTPEAVERKVAAAAPFCALKIKAGVPGDREIVRAVRRVSAQPLRIDANEGWKTRDEALEAIRWLEGVDGVQLVEQPLPAGKLRDVAWLRERVNLPIFADEDFTKTGDLENLAECYDGVNIKLMKTSGIRESVRAARLAKELGLLVMLGCMVESSVGTSAAAQISPLADFVDLDGSLLIDNDPFAGRVRPDGTISLGNQPGIGVTGELR
jgi:L-alanine-DL-glutamate epimerase-like enolase superfamily enzyme